MTAAYPRLAWVLIGLGFLLRVYYVLWVQPMGSAIFSDMKNYVQVADLIANGKWLATHFFQPIGFPYLILYLKQTTSNWIAWLEWIHILTSTATLWFFWKVAKESFGEKMGLCCLALAAIHFPWIAFVSLALAENLFIFFLSILAWLSWKLVKDQKSLDAILWALCFLVAFLIKGTHVFLGPLFLIGLFLISKAQLKNMVMISLVVGVGLLAHGYFTYSTIGKFQLSASAGGLNFLEGKCTIKNNADSAGYSWLSPLYYQLDLFAQKKWDRPFTDSGFYMKEGLKCIKEKPFVLIQSLEGIPFLFMGNTLWPANQFKTAGLMRLYELFYAVFCIVGIVVFIRMMFQLINKEEIVLWGLPILALFICVYIFKSEIRFRIPFDVWIIPVAMKGWVQLIKAKAV